MTLEGLIIKHIESDRTSSQRSREEKKKKKKKFLWHHFQREKKRSVSRGEEKSERNSECGSAPRGDLRGGGLQLGSKNPPQLPQTGRDGNEKERQREWRGKERKRVWRWGMRGRNRGSNLRGKDQEALPLHSAETLWDRLPLCAEETTSNQFKTKTSQCVKRRVLLSFVFVCDLKKS